MRSHHSLWRCVGLTTASCCLAMAGASLAGAAVSAGAAVESSKALVDFGQGFDLKQAKTRDAKASAIASATGPALRIAFGHTEPWPGVAFAPPSGAWDLSAYDRVAVEVRNVGTATARIGLRVDDTGSVGKSSGALQRFADVAPGQAETLEVSIAPRTGKDGKPLFFGMRGTPLDPGRGGGGEGASFGGVVIDRAKVAQVLVFVPKPTQDHQVEIGSIRAMSGLPGAEAQAFFPLMDEFGQYIQRDWPGKLHDASEFAARRKGEADDLAAVPAPANWDQYGGWKDGPALKATGFFYTAKHDGKWWLVDPEGRLFFSHGVDCVTNGEPTPIGERENWFRALPARDSEFKSCYGQGSGSRFYYAGKKMACFDFAKANLMRKYGASWQEEHGKIAQQRLRTWGVNTIGNWSDAAIRLLRKTPYTVSIDWKRKSIEPDKKEKGAWKSFPDPFDPSFGDGLRKRLADEKGKSAGDPWCIGYFLDNELPWGRELALATAVLTAPATQAAKLAFVGDLKAKYGAIEKLNAAWAAKRASWDALLEDREAPDQDKAAADLKGFAVRIAGQYFKTCRDAIKEAAPNQLYLGCRFAGHNPIVYEAAAKYCDVVSYNLYQTPEMLAKWRPDTATDAPIIIGEFHFGALDRGMFHTGLRAVKDQNERAKAYKDYVTTALRNPLIVGCHWFKYRDEPTTGRPADGENFQIGFVDVADTPYSETIAAAREMGHSLYAVRTAGE